MNHLSKHLEQLRDELADAFTWKRGIKESDGVEFKAGWSALLKLLEQAAGEFDYSQSDKASTAYCGEKNSRQRTSMNETFNEGARWQFEQDRARIGRADEVAKREINVQRAYFNQTTQALQDKLAAAETANQNFSQLLIIAEARIKELEKHLQMYGDKEKA